LKKSDEAFLAPNKKTKRVTLQTKKTKSISPILRFIRNEAILHEAKFALANLINIASFKSGMVF